MKLTRKKAKFYLKDEKKASKEYKNLKLKKLSKDENSHYKYFKKFLNKKL
jgi:rubrerythrin